MKGNKKSLKIMNTSIAAIVAAGLFLSGITGGDSYLRTSYAQEITPIVSEDNTDEIIEDNTQAEPAKEDEELEALSANAGTASGLEDETTEKQEKTEIVDSSNDASSASTEEIPTASNSSTEESTTSSTASTEATSGSSDSGNTGSTTPSEPTPESSAASNEASSAPESSTASSEASSAPESSTASSEASSAPESTEPAPEPAPSTAGSPDDGYVMVDPSETYDVTKPTVKLESMSLVKVYDGKPLVDDMGVLFVEEGWLDGDGATYTFTESQTEVGSVPNKFTVKLNEGTPADKYNIVVKYGELRVVENLDAQQYILTITGNSGNVKYNGQAQTLSGFSLSARGNDEYRVEGIGDPAESVSFTMNGATYSVSGISAVGSGTNAGEYLVDITGSPVVRDAAGNDVTKDFKFEYLPGTLTIDKRNITMTSASAEKSYDGEELTKHEVKVTGDGFVDGEGATYQFTGKQKDVGESYNYFTYTMNDGTLEANYKVSKVPGKLKVKKAESNSSTEGTSSEGSQTESSGSSSDSSSVASSSSSSTADAPSVLGARKDKESGTDTADTSKGQVLGARRGETADATTGVDLRLMIMLISAMTVIIITGKNKRRNNG